MYQWGLICCCLCLAACQAASLGQAVAVDEEAVVCQGPRPAMCTMDYRPVCVKQTGGIGKTYGNACSACGDPEVHSYRQGECQ